MSQLTTYLSLLLVTILLTGCNLTQPYGIPAGTSKNDAPTGASPAAGTKEYRSEFMKISLQVPNDWQIEDQKIGLNLTSPDSKKLSLSRNGTNWDTLEGVLEEIKMRKEPVVMNEQFITINSNSSVVRTEQFNVGPIKEQKIYYIYSNYSFFTLSTSSPDLYDDLDSIAQSFQYFGK